MKELSLKSILKCVNGKTNNINNDIYVKGVSTDTRDDLKDKLYIALEGENFDGHNFIDQAIEKGAIAVIAHKEADVEFNNLITVKDTKQALVNIAGYYRSLFNIKMVGVTGSVGKTTTKEMIASVVSQKFNVLKTNKNLNNEIGVSKTLFGLNNDVDVAVIEMGMCNFGEISELSNIIKPDIGIVTNIGVSHIEALGSRENILKAKMEICDGMEHDSLLILNKDNELLGNYVNKNHQTQYYSIGDVNADVFAENISYDIMTTNFDIVDGPIRTRVQLPCLGEHNIGNALIAYLVGRKLDISIDQILNGLKMYTPSGMRQKMVDFNGVTIVEDCYNASPDSMRAAIKTLSHIKAKGKRIMVISDMLELGHIAKQEHYNIGKLIAENNIDEIYCVGDLSKNYVLGALDHGMSEQSVKIFDDKLELTENLKRNMKQHDIIWVKASRGMKLEEVLEKIYIDLEK